MRPSLITAAICILSFSTFVSSDIVPQTSQGAGTHQAKDDARIGVDETVLPLAADNTGARVADQNAHAFLAIASANGILPAFQPSDHFRSTLSFTLAEPKDPQPPVATSVVPKTRGASVSGAAESHILSPHAGFRYVDRVTRSGLADRIPATTTAYAADEAAATADADQRSPSDDAAQAIDVALIDTAKDAADGVKTPRPRPLYSRNDVCDALTAAAEQHELPAPFLTSLIWQESRFDPEAVSPVGAQGIAQFMPRIASAFGLSDPFDPRQALAASARMLRGLVDQFGNLGLAAAAYNAGSGRVENWLTKGGKLPQETRKYVLHITGRTAEHWRMRARRHGVVKVASAAPCPGVASFAEALNATTQGGTTTVADATGRVPIPVSGQVQVKGGRQTLVIAMHRNAASARTSSAKPTSFNAAPKGKKAPNPIIMAAASGKERTMKGRAIKGTKAVALKSKGKRLRYAAAN